MSYSTCSIRKHSDLAKHISRAKALIWDEVLMTHRYTFEALDRTLRDIMEVDTPFGGKLVIIGGGFRQGLPVVSRGTMLKMINACIVKSHL